MKATWKKYLALLLSAGMIFSLTCCSGSQKSADSNNETSTASEKATITASESDTEMPPEDASSPASGIDYTVLVNKLNPLPDNWEDELETEHMTNSIGDDVEVEKKAYAAYLQLKKALEAEDIHVDLDSARRSVAVQQEIMDNFIEESGSDYAAKTVAKATAFHAVLCIH